MAEAEPHLHSLPRYSILERLVPVELGSLVNIFIQFRLITKSCLSSVFVGARMFVTELLHYTDTRHYRHSPEGET